MAKTTVQRTQWTRVSPSDYDLDDMVDTLERVVSVELETGLRVQVLRAVPLPSNDKWAIKRAVQDDGTWAEVTVTRRGQYVYVVVVHEE
jgi:hypothetical protein